MRKTGKQIVGRRADIVMINESKFGHKRKLWILLKHVRLLFGCQIYVSLFKCSKQYFNL